MRILHVIPSLAAINGGPGVVVLQLSNALSDFGVESAVFTTDMVGPANAKTKTWSRAPEVLVPNVNLIDTRFFETRPPHSWCYSPGMATALKSDVANFDLVHIHSLNLFPQFAAARACRAAGVPYIVTPHGALEPFLRSRNRGRKFVTDLLWQRKMLDSAAAIHVTSDREATLVRAAAIRSPIVTVPLGMELEQFVQANKPRPDLREGNRSVVILNHGRLHPKKGLDVAVRAMPPVISRFPNARLELIGPDDTGVGIELDRLARELGIGNAVVRIGPLSGRELAERVAAADVWVLPSKGENFGIAVGEAMAAGVPVVATGVVDFASSAAAEHAVVIAAGTPEAFSTAIIALLANPVRAADICNRGSAFVKHFGWSEITSRVLEVYASIVSRG